MLNIEQLSLNPVDCDEHHKSDDVDNETWDDIPNEGVLNDSIFVAWVIFMFTLLISVWMIKYRRHFIQGCGVLNLSRPEQSPNHSNVQRWNLSQNALSDKVSLLP